MSKSRLLSSTKRIHFFIEYSQFFGSVLFLLGLGVALLAYLLHISILNYLSFLLLCLGWVLLFIEMKNDLSKTVHSRFMVYILIGLILFLYFLQRLALPEFFFSVADASDYYLSGVNSVLHKNDIGFFLPLTASVSAVGFMMLGYKYALLMIVFVYSAFIPLTYFILKKLKLTTAISLVFVVFISLTPLSIWFSKTSFSEPIWQILLLFLILVSYSILDKKNIELSDLLILSLVLILAPFSRGEAIVLYAIIGFLSVYYYWKFDDLKSSLFIALNSIFLAISIHTTLSFRSHYLLDWQFNRVIPHISIFEIMTIVYIVSVLLIILPFFMKFLPKKFKNINLPLILVLLAIVFKIVIAVYFSRQKHMEFIDLFFTNEYSFAIHNFTPFIVFIIILGLILLHIKATQDNKMSLILVLMYAIFSLPFTMQATSFSDTHQFFLYWNRYYFSILMMIHLFSFAIAIQFIYNKLDTIIPTLRYKQFLVIGFIVVMTLLPMDYKLAKIVRNDAYLVNSSKLFPWIAEKVLNKSISIVYPSNVSYGNYDLKQLIKRGLEVTNTHVKFYRKIRAKEFDNKLNLPSKLYQSKFLLCFSQKTCKFDNHDLKLIDTLPIVTSWRTHQPDIVNSHKTTMNITAYLYKMQ